MSDLSEVFADAPEKIHIPRGRRTPDSMLVPVLKGMPVSDDGEHRKQLVLNGTDSVAAALPFLAVEFVPEGTEDVADWQARRLIAELYKAARQAGRKTRSRKATLPEGRVLVQFWIKADGNGEASGA